MELRTASEHLARAREDARLPEEHRRFLAGLEWQEGLPRHDGRLAGIGGTFVLRAT